MNRTDVFSGYEARPLGRNTRCRGNQQFLESHLRQALSFSRNQVTSWQPLHKADEEKGRKLSQIPENSPDTAGGSSCHRYTCHIIWQGKRRVTSGHPFFLAQQPSSPR